MNVLLISNAYDSGHYQKRMGVGSAVLAESISHQLKGDGYTVVREEVSVEADFHTEATTAFAASRKIAEYVKNGSMRGDFPVIFSGNCTPAAVGTLSGLPEETGVIWFDCHGDFNTPETTIGGFLDGMALSIVTGHCWTQLAASVPGFHAVEEKKILLAGARDFDPLEYKRLQASGIIQISPGAIQQSAHLFEDQVIPVNAVYLHIDLDVLDAGLVRVNTYGAAGGISPETLYKALASIRRKYTVQAVSFTSYDPSLDIKREIPHIVNSALKSLLTSS
jgi:arginase